MSKQITISQETEGYKVILKSEDGFSIADFALIWSKLTEFYVGMCKKYYAAKPSNSIDLKELSLKRFEEIWQEVNAPTEPKEVED